MVRSLSLLGALATVTAAVPAAADDEPLAIAHDARQVALAVDVGMSGGGVGTPGGLRVGGHYLYRLADRDWFDSSLAFTFGGQRDACMGAPVGEVIALAPCDRAVTDGFAGDLSLGLRRELAPRGGFTPWLRAAGFLRALRFADVGGFAAGGELGAGVRAPVRGGLALGAAATAFYGVPLGDALAESRQLGLTVTVGAELAMR